MQIQIGQRSKRKESFCAPIVCLTIPPMTNPSQGNAINADDCQSCEMSKFVHRSNLSNQVLPQERRVNRDKFST